MVSDKAEYNRQYNAEHKDEIREQKRQYRATHRDKVNEYQRQYRTNHKKRLREYDRQYRCAKGTRRPMSENRACPAFLGVHVAERMLAHLFKDVIRMPNNHQGFDFFCSNGYKIDVKSACVSKNGKWQFNIRQNVVADYFLCMAFDDREQLNPEHVWLIPSSVLQHLKTASIYESTLENWAEYEKPIDEAICCCNTMKEEI